MIAVKLFIVKKFVALAPLGFPNPSLRMAQYAQGTYSLKETLVCVFATIQGAIVGTAILRTLLNSAGQVELSKLIVQPEPKKCLTQIQIIAINVAVAASYVICVLKFIRGGRPLVGIGGLVCTLIAASKCVGSGAMDPASVVATSVVATYTI